MTMRVGILGCGYVGLELGRQLRKRGHDVVGVRRSEEGIEAVEAADLDPIQADVTDSDSLDSVPDVDALVYLVSSGGGGIDAARRAYIEGPRTVIEAFEGRSDPPDRLLYASSTGVYGDHGGGWVDESTPLDPQTDRERVLAEGERIALSGSTADDDRSVPETEISGTVVRFAGLYGPDRYRLDRYLDGSVTAGWLNVLHRDDAAGVLRFLLENDLARDDLVLAVDDEPVERPTLARWLASECGVDPPKRITIEERIASDDLSSSAQRRIRSNRRCRNDRLRELGYEFTYPTYREGYRSAVEMCLDDG